jgi:tetratricopeptide (TPR) repeat protein
MDLAGRVLVAALLAAFSTGRLAGQGPERVIRIERPVLLLSPGGSITRPRLIAWVNCVNGHRLGEFDAARETLGTYKQDELAAVVAAIQRGKMPVSAAGIPSILRRATVLHTELAIDEMQTAGRPDIATTAVGATNLSMAGRLVDELRKREPRDPVVRAWFVTAGAILLAEREVSNTADLLERGLDLFPADPQLLLFVGAAYEWRASFRVQDAEDLGDVRERIGGRAENLVRAEASYRSALEQDPTLIEAQVRLGRVVALRGKHADAARELEAARASLSRALSASPAVQFYASLFLGDELVALGRNELARTSYQRALVLYPGADSAHMALANLEHIAGARDAALAVVVDMIRQRDASPMDPWRDYYRAGEARNVARLLGTLGEMVWSRQ